jgi:parallel beta-helix repeat protein
VPDLDLAKPYQTGNERIQFAPGEITHWKGADIVFMTFRISSRRRITAVDEAQRIATLDRRTTMRLTDGFGKAPLLARYYTENAMGLLDTPGEWFLNRQTGMVYYMPLPGEEVDKVEAIAPVLDQLLILDGKPKEDRPVEHLTFRGLTFSYAEFWPPEHDRGDRFQRQAAGPMPGAIELTGARRCSFTQCAIAHVSSNAIHFSRGCQHDQLTGSKLFDLGAGGVKVGGTERLGDVPQDSREETHDIEISDNDIREGGRVFHQGHGVLVGQSYNNVISHNHVHDFYQNGISLGWTWGYGKSMARNNVVEYNHIHLIGQGWLSDLAGVYTVGVQPGTVIRNNLIHDVECSDYVGRGIYLDEGSSGIVVENNIVYHTSTGGFGMNFGKGNTIRNNVFAFGERSQIEPVANMAKAPGSSYLLERNIFLLKKGQNVLRGNWQPKPADELLIRGNLYWNDGGEVLFGARTFSEWQAVGLDKGSIVADPLFTDAETGNFTLKAGSPALKMGFEPIDVSGVGPHAAARKAIALE